MIIGVPKEIKNNENRVGMTPAGVAELVKRGHTVYVQASAGANSGFSDDDYIAVGAQMLPTIEDTYAIADMIVKVWSISPAASAASSAFFSFPFSEAVSSAVRTDRKSVV